MAIYRVRRYVKMAKKGGRIFSVAEHTAQTKVTTGQSLSSLSRGDKRKLAKKALERSRIIQAARVRAIGMRAK